VFARLLTPTRASQAATPSTLQPLDLEVWQWEGASLPQLRACLHQLSGHASTSKNKGWLRRKIHSFALEAGYDVSADHLPLDDSQPSAARTAAGEEAGEAVEAGDQPKLQRRTKHVSRAWPGLINGAPVVELESRTRPRSAPRRFDDGAPDGDSLAAAAGGIGTHFGDQQLALKRKRTAGRARGGDKAPAYRKTVGWGDGGDASAYGHRTASPAAAPRLKSTSMGRLTRMHPVRRKPLSGGTVGGYPTSPGCHSRPAAAAHHSSAVAPLASMRLACGTVLSPGDDVFVLTPKGLHHLHTCPLCSADTTSNGAAAAAAAAAAAPRAEGAPAPPPSAGDELLECDKCLRGFHLTCLNLPAIPDGDWTCADCCLAAASTCIWDVDADVDMDGEQCEAALTPQLTPTPTPVPACAPVPCPPRVIIDDMDRVDAGLLHLAHVEALWWDAAQRAVLFRARWYHCSDQPDGATLAQPPPEGTPADHTGFAACGAGLFLSAGSLLGMQTQTPAQPQQQGGASVRWWVPGMVLPLREVALCPPGTSDVAFIGSVLRKAHVVPPDQAAKAARDAAAEGKPLPVVCHRGYDPRLKRFTPLRR
jgi:hypothetical protein